MTWFWFSSRPRAPFLFTPFAIDYDVELLKIPRKRLIVSTSGRPFSIVKSVCAWHARGHSDARTHTHTHTCTHTHTHGAVQAPLACAFALSYSPKESPTGEKAKNRNDTPPKEKNLVEQPAASGGVREREQER